MKRGFTLIEIIVVVAIISIGTLLILPDSFGFIEGAQIESCYSAEKSAITEINFYLAHDNNGSFKESLIKYCDESVASVENTKKLFENISTSMYISDCPTGGEHTVHYNNATGSVEVICDKHGSVINGLVSNQDSNSGNDNSAGDDSNNGNDNSAGDDSTSGNDNNTDEDDNTGNDNNTGDDSDNYSPFDTDAYIFNNKHPKTLSSNAAQILYYKKKFISKLLKDEDDYISLSKNTATARALKNIFTVYNHKKNKMEYENSYVLLENDIITFCYYSNNKNNKNNKKNKKNKQKYYCSYIEDDYIYTY